MSALCEIEQEIRYLGAGDGIEVNPTTLRFILRMDCPCRVCAMRLRHRVFDTVPVSGITTFTESKCKSFKPTHGALCLHFQDVFAPTPLLNDEFKKSPRTEHVVR